MSETCGKKCQLIYYLMLKLPACVCTLASSQICASIKRTFKPAPAESFYKFAPASLSAAHQAMSGGPEHGHSTCLTVCFVEAVAFVQSTQIILSGLTPPTLPLCHCCDWCLFHPAALSQLKRKKPPIPLTFTLTWLFPLNTHENTQPWHGCSLSYFSQISLCVLPFFQSFKGMPGFLLR